MKRRAEREKERERERERKMAWVAFMNCIDWCLGAFKRKIYLGWMDVR
jgi:hypothetical protein